MGKLWVWLGGMAARTLRDTVDLSSQPKELDMLDGSAVYAMQWDYVGFIIFISSRGVFRSASSRQQSARTE
jgi:hypothetical protein